VSLQHLTKEKEAEIKDFKGKTYKTQKTYRLIMSGERANLFLIR